MYKKERKQEVDMLLAKIDEGVQSFLTSDKYKEMLVEVSKFRRYSFYNMMLILTQMENPTKINSCKRWNELGRYVKSGEKAMKILAPLIKHYTVEEAETDLTGNVQLVKKEKTYLAGFRPVPVFDISQTDGKELTMDKICTSVKGDVRNLDDYFQTAKGLVDIPIVIKEKPLHEEAKGYCSIKEIVVYKDTELQMLKTLFHELGHVLLKHTSPECDIPRDEKECQAESVAFIVSNSLGFDVSEYSFEYIGTWANNRKVEDIKKSLSSVVDVTKKILDKVELIQQNQAA